MISETRTSSESTAHLNETLGQDLQAEGVAVSLAQVEQAVVQSGWAKLRQTLFARLGLVKV